MAYSLKKVSNFLDVSNGVRDFNVYIFVNLLYAYVITKNQIFLVLVLILSSIGLKGPRWSM